MMTRTATLITMPMMTIVVAMVIALTFGGRSSDTTASKRESGKVSATDSRHRKGRPNTHEKRRLRTRANDNDANHKHDCFDDVGDDVVDDAIATIDGEITMRWHDG